MKVKKNQTKKEIIVKWCKEPVFIYGLNEKYYHWEVGLHIYFADWLRKNRCEFWHHSANESYKPGQHGLFAKRMMQSKGFLDFIQPGLRLAIEFKRDDGEVSSDQESWINYLIGTGWKVLVTKHFEEARDFVLANS